MINTKNATKILGISAAAVKKLGECAVIRKYEIGSWPAYNADDVQTLAQAELIEPKNPAIVVSMGVPGEVDEENTLRPTGWDGNHGMNSKRNMDAVRQKWPISEENLEIATLVAVVGEFIVGCWEITNVETEIITSQETSRPRTVRILQIKEASHNQLDEWRPWRTKYEKSGRITVGPGTNCWAVNPPRQ